MNFKILKRLIGVRLFIKVAVLSATEMKLIPVGEITLLQDIVATEKQEYM